MAEAEAPITPSTCYGICGQDGPAKSAVVADKRDVDSLTPTTVQTPDDVLCGDALIEPAVMAHRASPGTDVNLADESSTGFLSVSVFAAGHSEHLPSSQATTPAEELDCNSSVLSGHQNEIRSLAHQFGFCCHYGTAVFGHCYFQLQDVTPVASSYMEDQEKASPEHRIYDTLWHRCTEDGKVEYLLVPATVR